MKKLVIAEKPSFARNIMSALAHEGETFKKSGEFSESENYIVTSAFGHIFGLAMPEEYSESEDRDFWDVKNLPFFPEQYLFLLNRDLKTKKVDAGAKARFNAIKNLLKSDEIDEVIHCGDADREGQLIVDLILEQANNKKQVTRPLIKDMTPETILKAFNSREDNSKYKLVHEEGLARTLVDFDYGINLSRYANIKTGAQPALNIGRVIGAMVNAIYERDMNIKNFKPEKYYQVAAHKQFDDEQLDLVDKEQFKDQDAAMLLAEKLSANPVKVVLVENKIKTVPAPKLFSQSTLQNRMSKLHKFPPKKTLEIAQSLYEKGYTTYPRTNSEYLTENEIATVKNLLEVHDKNNNLEFRRSKRIFDSSKVDGHTAIVPTGKVASGLTAEEQAVYDAIMCRFSAAFWAEECKDSETKITLDAAGHEFIVTGITEQQKGWRSVENVEKKNKQLPRLHEGETFTAAFSPEEKETTPPSHYTIETFNNFLKNPFKTEKTSEDQAYKDMLAGIEIGTEATRAGLIDKAISKEYIELKNSTYTIADRGIYLVEVMRSLGIDMSKEKTTYMSQMTTDVAKGRRSVDEVLKEVHQEIAGIIKADMMVEKDSQSQEQAIGKCPVCGSDVVNIDHAKLKAYKCSSTGCDFILWKNIFGATLTEDNAKKLLLGEWTSPMACVNKAGKPYRAKIKLKEDNKSFDLEFVNSVKKGSKKGGGKKTWK